MLADLAAWFSRSLTLRIAAAGVIAESPDARSGVLVWSKWPLSDVRYNDLDANSSVRALVDAPQGRFTVSSVHVASPISGEDLERWHHQYEGLSQLSTDDPAFSSPTTSRS